MTSNFCGIWGWKPNWNALRMGCGEVNGAHLLVKSHCKVRRATAQQRLEREVGSKMSFFLNHGE